MLVRMLVMVDKKVVLTFQMNTSKSFPRINTPDDDDKDIEII